MFLFFFLFSFFFCCFWLSFDRSSHFQSKKSEQAKRSAAEFNKRNTRQTESGGFSLSLSSPVCILRFACILECDFSLSSSSFTVKKTVSAFLKEEEDQKLCSPIKLKTDILVKKARVDQISMEEKLKKPKEEC